MTTDLKPPKMLTNLPAGKAFIMPREGTMNGTIIMDGSMGFDTSRRTTELQVEDGVVVDVKGGQIAANIRQDLVKSLENYVAKTEKMFGLLQNLVLE